MALPAVPGSWRAQWHALPLLLPPEAPRSESSHILRAGEPLPSRPPMPMTSQEPSLDCELFEDCDLLLSLHSPAQALAGSRWSFTDKPEGQIVEFLLLFVPPALLFFSLPTF